MMGIMAPNGKDPHPSYPSHLSYPSYLSHPSRPMRIALVTDWCRPRVGGIEHHVHELARELVARGHDVHVVTTTPGAVVPAGARLHAFRVAMLGDVAAPNLFKIRTLARLLTREGIDIVHAHGMFSTTAIGGLLAARMVGIPSVTTNHSLLQTNSTLPAAFLVFHLFSGSAGVISAVSEAAAEDARLASGRRDVVCLPNGIDAGWWHLPHQDAGPLRIATVMRLVAKKSPGDLIAAIQRAPAEVCGRPVVFTIVGDGPERPRLERDAAAVGAARRVEFRGTLDREAVRSTLASSSVFALPCRREAFGLAILEARAAGLPVVAMRAGGVPEVVTHGENGLLARDRDEFARHVATLVTDEAQRLRLASSSRRGLEAFTWEGVIARHLEVYEMARVSSTVPR